MSRLPFALKYFYILELIKIKQSLQTSTKEVNRRRAAMMDVWTFEWSSQNHTESYITLLPRCRFWCSSNRAWYKEEQSIKEIYGPKAQMLTPPSFSMATTFCHSTAFRPPHEGATTICLNGSEALLPPACLTNSSGVNDLPWQAHIMLTADLSYRYR